MTVLVIVSLLAVVGAAVAVIVTSTANNDDQSISVETQQVQQSIVETQTESEETGEKFIMVISGAIDESTGKSWCPHSNYAKPYIDSLLNDIGDRRRVVEAFVTRSEWKGNSDHPYRQAPYNV